MRDVGDNSVYMANVRVRIARSLVAAKLFPEAERLLKPAHENLVSNFGAANPDAVAARELHVELYEAWGRPDQAKEFSDPGGSERRSRCPFKRFPRATPRSLRISS